MWVKDIESKVDFFWRYSSIFFLGIEWMSRRGCERFIYYRGEFKLRILYSCLVV